MSDTIQIGTAVRCMGGDAASMEEAAGRVVRYLHEHLNDEDGKPASVLTRFYKSHRFGALPSELQEFAQGILGDIPATDDLRCLTLLATAGKQAAWNDRTQSRGHKAIPLPSASSVEQLPMVLQLVRQLGIEVSDLVKPTDTLMMEANQKTFNVFFVENAPGSAFIPAQEGFVNAHGVRSVIGFGGVLPNGDMYAVIQFYEVKVTSEIAQLFKTLALNVKLAILPFVDGKVFA